MYNGAMFFFLSPTTMSLCCRLSLGKRLPEDVLLRIEDLHRRHLAASRLQGGLRGLVSRRGIYHRRKSLYHEIHIRVELCRPGLSGVLCMYPGVRQQWYDDPAAWVHLLESESAEYRLLRLLRECRAGEWGLVQRW